MPLPIVGGLASGLHSGEVRARSAVVERDDRVVRGERERDGWEEGGDSVV